LQIRILGGSPLSHSLFILIYYYLRDPLPTRAAAYWFIDLQAILLILKKTTIITKKKRTAMVAATQPQPPTPTASTTTSAEEEALKRNTDCVYFLASPLTCKKVRFSPFLFFFHFSINGCRFLRI